MNWQHCAHEVFFASHSFEQYYQGVRRCWRFGQKNPVTINVIASEGQAGILDNLRRKNQQADEMFTNLISHMNNILQIKTENKLINKERLPLWL